MEIIYVQEKRNTKQKKNGTSPDAIAKSIIRTRSCMTPRLDRLLTWSQTYRRSELEHETDEECVQALRIELKLGLKSDTLQKKKNIVVNTSNSNKH